MPFLETIGASFGLVAASEMGDKTQLLALSLAARFKKPVPILGGILIATVLNHGLASTAGSWISTHVSASLLAGILGVTFIAFGLWTLKPDDLEEPKESRWGPFLTTVVLFFLAEMGDKTQLATVALAAKYGSVWWVTFGTTLGMLAADGAAVFFGEAISRRLGMRRAGRIGVDVHLGASQMEGRLWTCKEERSFWDRPRRA